MSFRIFDNIYFTSTSSITELPPSTAPANSGLEFAIANNWSAKAEYLYVNLGRFNCGIGCGAATDNVSFNANLVRGGINYRF